MVMVKLQSPLETHEWKFFVGVGDGFYQGFCYSEVTVLH